MKFKTNISKTHNGKHFIYGHDLVELANKNSFSEVIFLLLKGVLPSVNEKMLLDSMLVLAVENGIEAPSIYVPRIVAASGNDFQTALAAGMVAVGEKHGGAAEKAAEVFASEKTVPEILEGNKVIPGFGHKVYKDSDPRAEALHAKAASLGFSCKYFDRAKQIEKGLAEKKGKTLPLNIDGALACCLLELGLSPKLGKAVFLISRIVGMSAHVAEEYQQGNNYYRLEESDVTHEN